MLPLPSNFVGLSALRAYYPLQSSSRAGTQPPWVARHWSHRPESSTVCWTSVKP